MRIRELTLKNIKSYAEETLRFHDGVNFISGVNGAGKTTVIESIGYALFDCKPGTINEFVRYGCRTGVITIEFEANDNRLYRVVRKVGANNSWLIFDVETDTELDLHGAADVKPWLKKYLGLEEDQDLSQLFSDVVGVSQGTFTAPFLETPAVRNQKFNKMLKVEAYRDAYEKTRNAVRYIDDVLKKEEIELEVLRERVRNYDEVKKAIDNLILMIEELKQELTDGKQRLDKAVARRDAMRATKKDLDDTIREIQVNEVRIRSVQDTLKKLKEEIFRAQEAISRMEQARPGYITYQQAQKTIESLNQKRKQRDDLKDRYSQSEVKIKALTAEVAARKKAVEDQGKEIGVSELSLKESMATNKELIREARIKAEEIQAIREAWNGDQQQLQSFEKDLGGLSQLSMRLQDGLDKWKLLHDDMARLEERLAGEAKIKTELEFILTLERERDTVGKTLAVLEQKLETMTENQHRVRSGNCPFMDAPCRNVEGDLHHFFTEQIDRTRDELKSLMTRKQELEEGIQKGEAFKLALQGLENDRQNLKKCEEERAKFLKTFRTCFSQVLALNIGKKSCDILRLCQDRSRIAGSLKTQDRLSFGQIEEEKHKTLQLSWDHFSDGLGSISEMQGNGIEEGFHQLEGVAEQGNAFMESVKSLISGSSELLIKEANIRSVDLAQVVSKQQMMEGQLKELELRRRKLEEERSAITARGNEIGQMENEKFKLLQDLQQFEGLDERLAKEQGILAGSQEAYDTYMKHQGEAQKAGVLEKEYEDKDKLLNTYLAAAEQLQERQKGLSSRFDEEVLSGLEKQVEKMNGELAASENRLSERQKDLRERTEEVRMMEKAQKEMTKIRERMERHRACQELLGFIRGIFKQAGERVAAVYREYLAKEADRIYREVSRENVALQWRDSYEITLVDVLEGRERERVFRQLSGGEQMTAALAIRLGLLNQLSRINIGFFDEPTTNLDGERRSNLAQIIPQITGNFQQLFVISHDDSFDSMTENVIQLSKDAGEGTKLA